DLVRYASDASPYRLIPKVVVMAHGPADVAKTLAYGRSTGTPGTFRAGGTSLNGQGQTDGIMVDVRRHFTGFRVLEDGAAVRVKPGTVIGHVNRGLVKHQRRIGPDPAPRAGRRGRGAPDLDPLRFRWRPRPSAPG